MAGKKETPGLVEIVGDCDDFLEVKGFSSVSEGEQRSNPFVVGFHGVCWNAAFHEGFAHRERFVVFGTASISAEDDAAGFSRVVERCNSVHPSFEEGVRLVVALLGRGSEDENRGTGGDIVGFRGDATKGAEKDPEVRGDEGGCEDCDEKKRC
jgi:hypothetical protein